MSQHGHPKSFLLALVLVSVIVLADRKSKSLLLESTPPITRRRGGIRKKVTSFLNITLIWNKGMAFGFLNNYYKDAEKKFDPNSLLLVLSGFISCCLLYYLWRSGSIMNRISLALILAGALGNIVDRISYGAVVDFIDFHIADYHWPAFNLADSSIFMGVMLYLFAGRD